MVNNTGSNHIHIDIYHAFKQMSITKHVNMIFITAYGFHLDSVSLPYAGGSFYNNFLHFYTATS